MIFADLVNGDSVFLDANTLIYHFTFHARYGAAATDLVKRIERQELTGFTSTHILTEVAHRMMTIEASARFGWPFAGIANRLRRHPNEVRQLTSHRQAIDSIPNLRIQVLMVPPALISTACAMSQTTGLLSNDALLVAIMQANALDKLASEDSDFDRIQGLIRYAPA